MKRIVAAAGAALWLSLGGPAWANVESGMTQSSVSQADLENLRARLHDVAQKVQDPNVDKPAAIAALRDILKDANFPALSGLERHGAQLILGLLLTDAKDYQAAREPIRAASEMAEAGEMDWSTRFSNSYRLQDYADCALALTKLAQHWPAKLADYYDEAIYRVVNETQKQPANAALARDVLEALYAAKWRPTNPFHNVDSLWLSLLRIRLESGDVAGAGIVARDIGDPVTLLEMRADKRFDAVVRADPGRFDIVKAFEASLADVQAKSAAAPDKLEGVNAAAGLLLRLRRPKEALALIDAALARLAAKSDAYSDADEQIGWMKNQRADALFTLGRSDEAIAAMEDAATHKEAGRVNVSQAINLAETYALYDRPKDALAAVAALQFSDASEYGRMALEDARACPLEQLGDKAALAPVLEYMKAHMRDGAQPFFNTMLCVGDLDGAAAEVIAELNDPVLRPWMLYYLQDYAPSSYASKREAALHAAWIAVRGRADVAAAVAAVGRIESYDLKNPAY